MKQIQTPLEQKKKLQNHPIWILWRRIVSRQPIFPLCVFTHRSPQL
jgi:hypothetical protein